MAETMRGPVWTMARQSLLWKRTALCCCRQGASYHQGSIRGPARRQYSSSEPGVVSAPVPTRSVLSISGRDTVKLLQGLVSNDMKRLSPQDGEATTNHSAMYAVFLNPQGRLVADVFLHPHPAPPDPTKPHTLVECDSRALPVLAAFIQRFKLRSKVAIRDVSDEWAVWQVWGSQQDNPGWVDKLRSGEHVMSRDARAPGMGWRVLLSKNAGDPSLDNTLTEEDYSFHRIQHAVPEGPIDFIEGSTLPLEASVDYMGGVDFKKGCYVGQELTARTHHTGVVRKRVLPVTFYREGEEPPSSIHWDKAFNASILPRSEIRSSVLTPVDPADSASTRPGRGRAAGKVSSVLNNVGLACLRLEQVDRWAAPGQTPDHAQSEALAMSIDDEQGTKWMVRPWRPQWWPPEKIGH